MRHRAFRGVTRVSFLVILSILSLLLCLGPAWAQEPTPFSPIVPQGNPNIGDVRPFSMTDVAERTGIAPWKDAGWTGAGVRIGVLDRGFGGLLNFEETFDVTVTTARSATTADYDASPIVHGTQVLEVLHQVAPGAELHVCEYDSLDSFNMCIDYMISVGVRVINHSAGVPALPLDGTNPWARQVDRATQADILWVQAAGNFAQGYYRDFFTNSDPGNPVHEFRGRTGIETALAIEAVSETATGVVMLSWEGHNDQPANAYDLDLRIFDAETGAEIGGSYGEQSGLPGQEPLEYDRIPMNRPFAIQIRDNTGEAFGVPFALYVEFAQVPSGSADRSIIAPGDSVNALTVGALQGLSIAPYSSRGPVGEGIIKPDITAPGEVLLSNGSRFIGTSAAAPVVAGAAALFYEANMNSDSDRIKKRLLESVRDDTEFLGTDTVYGRGRVFLPLVDDMSVSIPETILYESVPSNGQWTHIEREFDGIAMMLVPTGCFQMGSASDEIRYAVEQLGAPDDFVTDEQPRVSICLNDPFWIDKFEVTNEQFTALGGLAEKPSGTQLGDHPRTFVNWSEASAFCRLRGGQLPSEAQWEFAARGPDNLLFPWGNTFEGNNTNYCDQNCEYDWKDDRFNDAFSEVAPVGAVSTGASWVGALDLSGNVWEWVSNSYSDQPYDPTQSTSLDTRKVLRGGSWYAAAFFHRSANRNRDAPDFSDEDVGFRCVLPVSKR